MSTIVRFRDDPRQLAQHLLDVSGFGVVEMKWLSVTDEGLFIERWKNTWFRLRVFKLQHEFQWSFGCYTWNQYCPWYRHYETAEAACKGAGITPHFVGVKEFINFNPELRSPEDDWYRSGRR